MVIWFALQTNSPIPQILLLPQPRDLQRELPLGRREVRDLFAPIELAAFHTVSIDGVESCRSWRPVGDAGRLWEVPFVWEKWALTAVYKVCENYFKILRIIFKIIKNLCFPGICILVFYRIMVVWRSFSINLVGHDARGFLRSSAWSMPIAHSIVCSHC